MNVGHAGANASAARGDRSPILAIVHHDVANVGPAGANASAPRGDRSSNSAIVHHDVMNVGHSGAIGSPVGATAGPGARKNRHENAT
jgi:hypothetical protein